MQVIEGKRVKHRPVSRFRRAVAHHGAIGLLRHVVVALAAATIGTRPGVVAHVHRAHAAIGAGHVDEDDLAPITVLDRHV